MTNTYLKSSIFRLLASDHLLSNLPGHVYWKDLNGAFLGCNIEQANTFKLSDHNNVVGKTNFDFFDAETARNLNALDNMVIQENRTIEKIEKVGESEYFLSKKTPLRDQNGKIVGILGTSINITKQQQMEKELQQKTKELATAVETRDKVINIVSHEIKNTLQGMCGLSEEVLIAWNRIKDDEKKDCFQDVLNTRDRLTLFLEDLLEVAKSHSGTLKYTFSECRIHELVKKIASEYSRAPTVVTLHISEDAPETIYCDQNRVQQILDNLLRNAIRYGGQDQQITISVSTSPKSDDFIEITVRDQGVGVPDDEAELVFQSFYESTITRKKKGGTGLGLSICKEIVDAHHGKIWIESNQPKGAAFSFTMPKSADAYSQHAPSVQSKAQ